MTPFDANNRGNHFSKWRIELIFTKMAGFFWRAFIFGSLWISGDEVWHPAIFFSIFSAESFFFKTQFLSTLQLNLSYYFFDF